jgi:hypothetical protein
MISHPSIRVGEDTGPLLTTRVGFRCIGISGLVRPIGTSRRFTRPSTAALALTALLAPAMAQAQPPAARASDGVDPIRCWWRSSAGAVAIGEPFETSLTCALYDDASTSVIADESRLGAMAIQLGVFEVLGGTHPADLQTDTHRFFQYHYTLRVIDRDVIGKDATFPDIQVSYRVHTRSGADSTEGRDRTYVVPGQSIRVLSLVPGAAADIRDTPGENFAQVESLRFRSRALQLAALGLGAFGAIVLVPALLAITRRGRRPSAAEASRLHPSAVLAQVAKELTAVKADARGGWTVDLASRAAAAIRLAGSSALDRRISQRPEANGSTPAPGRLSVRSGLWRRKRVSTASTVTAVDLGAAIDRLPLTTPSDARETLEHLQRALSTLTATLYRPAFEPDTALDEALEAGLAATARLRRAHAWPRALRKSRLATRPAERLLQ